MSALFGHGTEQRCFTSYLLSNKSAMRTVIHVAYVQRYRCVHTANKARNTPHTC